MTYKDIYKHIYSMTAWFFNGEQFQWGQFKFGISTQGNF